MKLCLPPKQEACIVTVTSNVIFKNDLASLKKKHFNSTTAIVKKDLICDFELLLFFFFVVKHTEEQRIVSSASVFSLVRINTC